jgi:hypothetical protein
VNKNNGFTKRPKNERQSSNLFLFLYYTNFSFELDEAFFAQVSLLGLSKHNAQQMPLEAK